MKIALDTNVLVAGLLSPFGPCGEIVRMVSSGEVTLALDARILTEYQEVLARPKFKFDQDKVAAILALVEHCGVIVAATPLTQPLPDSDDEPFLEVAITARVACLVTGNRAHFPAESCQGATVLSPTEFLAFYRQHITNHRADG
jgi:putative PIN family toxin of toxin-antitoxin system